MRAIDLPKIDGHCHVLDPVRFPYAPDVAYRPQGQEIGTADYFVHVMKAYGVEKALLVGPNSGYGTDNRCLLDALARYPQRFKGVAVVPASCTLAELGALQAQGVVGIAFNPALHGLGYYAEIDGLLERLAALGMWAQFQVAGDQLAELLPRLNRLPLALMIDHCGRPVLADGPDAPGVRALLKLAEGGRTLLKLSGFAKFSQQGYPFEDCRARVRRLLAAFGPEQCIWASDWPYLRADFRLDYGTLLALADDWFTEGERRQIMWDTPSKIFKG